MAENLYEAMFIFDSGKFARNPAALPKDVEKAITDQGGKVEVSRLWEERRLAYSIRGQRKGTYWLVYFHTDSQHIKDLNHQFERAEPILRHLMLKVHPHLAEAVLAHASGEAEAEPAVTE